MTERRQITPSHLRRAGDTLTLARYDRREIYTWLDFFERCYHSPESISRHRSRTRLKPLNASLQIAEVPQSKPYNDWGVLILWLASQPDVLGIAVLQLARWLPAE